MRVPPLLLILLLSSCGRAERERAAAVDSVRAATLAQIEDVLSETIRRTDRLAGSANRILSPLPVMTPAEEDALRRYLNAAHVAQARALGVRASDDEAIELLIHAHYMVRPTRPAGSSVEHL